MTTLEIKKPVQKKPFYTKEERAARWKIWSAANQDKLKEYRKKNRAKISARMKKWYAETGYNAKYHAKNRETHNARMMRYYQENKKQIREKLKQDPFYSLKKSVRHAVERITERGAIKECKSMRYLGCSLEFARAHIESKFKPGMTWDNHGSWEIDHIKPIASFDFSIPENAFLASRWDNLQPLWKAENRAKWAKVA